MSFAPEHDWVAYEAQTAEDDVRWLRSLGTGERFAIYADLFAVVWTARQHRGRGDWEALDRWNWQQKLALRLRCVEAYHRRDEIRDGRAPAADAG